MSVPEDPSLLAIDVSADDYAKVAATDQEAPSAEEKQARTHQTEEAFQAEKATYHAKIDDGDIWKRLSEIDPPFQSSPPSAPATPTTTTSSNSTAAAAAAAASTTSSEPAPTKRKLGKKEWLLTIAAVGELYWAGDYTKILQICEWAEGNFELDARMAESVGRWREKSTRKLV